MTRGTLDRNATLDVVSDQNGIVGLGVNDTVRIGNTDDMVSVTNNVNREMTVTVTLDPAYQTAGDLVVNGVNYGDTATVTLSPNASETVEVDLATGCSLDGETLTYDLDGNATTFDGNAPRSAVIEAPNATRMHVAFTNATDGQLQMIDQSGTVATFGFATNGFGAPSADYDCDGRTEIPFVTGTGAIDIIDATGERQELLSGGARTGARLGVADIDGDDKPAVLYSNVNDNGTLYRAEHGESPVEVADVEVHSVTRRADVNGDGDLDIAFTDPNGNLKYYDNATTYDVGVDPGQKTYIGDPTNFDGDGEVRIPYVSHNDRLMLVDSDGNSEQISGGADTVSGSLATFDYDEDGKIEIVYVDSGDGILKHVEMYGSTIQVTDDNGNTVYGGLNGTA